MSDLEDKLDEAFFIGSVGSLGLGILSVVGSTIPFLLDYNEIGTYMLCYGSGGAALGLIGTILSAAGYAAKTGLNNW